MSAVERRQPLPVPEVIDTWVVPLIKKRRALAELRAMHERGEIAYAFNPETIVMNGQRMWRVKFVRLAEPRPRAPLYATLSAAVLGGVVAVGAMVWHARHVFLAGLGILAGTVVLALLALRLATHSAGCAGLHCPGCRG